MIITNAFPIESTPNTMKTFQEYHPTSEVIYHPALGAFSVIQNPQGHKLLKKNLSTHEIPHFDLSKYDRYLNIEYPRILEFKGMIPNHESGYSVFCEYFNGTLKEEIEQRFLTKKPYTELEILSILQNVSSSLSYLQSIKIYHGGIKSSSIVNNNGDYKVLNPALFKASTQEHTKFIPNLPNSKTRIITPEIRNAFYREALDSVHETYKDDVYGLGLIALDLMTLQVDPSIPVEKRLERSNFAYSNTLVRFVKKMLENVLTLRLDPVSCNSYIEQIHLQHGLVSFRRFTRGFASDQSQLLERSMPPVRTPVQKDRERAAESVTPTYRRKPANFSLVISDISPIQSQYTHTPPQIQEKITIQSLKDESITSNPLRQSEPVMRLRETIVYKKVDRPLDESSSVGKSSISTEINTQRSSKVESFVRGSTWSLFETPRVSVALRYPNVHDKSPLFESKLTSNFSRVISDKENHNTSNLQSPEIPKHTIRVTSQVPLDADMKKIDNQKVQISTRICPKFFDDVKTPKNATPTHVIQEVSSELASVGLKEAVSFYVDESATTPLRDKSNDEILSSTRLSNRNELDFEFKRNANPNHSVVVESILEERTSFESQKHYQRPVETVTVRTFYSNPQPHIDSAISLYNSSLRTSYVSDMKSQSTMTKTVTEKLSDGSLYEGEMFGYMKQGRGKLTYPDGKYYDGEWKVGRINGQGTLYNRDGSVIYEGQWKNEKYHGKGVLYNPHQRLYFDEPSSQLLKLSKRRDQAWAKYEGNFQDGMWEGSGDLSFKNGDRYIGDFKKDKIEGRGIFVGISGKIVEGAWKDYCLVESLY